MQVGVLAIETAPTPLPKPTTAILRYYYITAAATPVQHTYILIMASILFYELNEIVISPTKNEQTKKPYN